MFEPTAIFQRTQAGRDEIHEKKRGLTQSERLVLIMVDGTTPYEGVRSKLPVLAEERFQRALTTLQKKDLVIEVFLPVEGQEPEEVAQTVIDRFIQQDPNDPLTIISFDPEEDFGVFGPAFSAAAESRAVGSDMPEFPSGGAMAEQSIEQKAAMQSVHNAFSGHVGLMDDTLIQQADALAEEVRAQRPQYDNPIEKVRDLSARRRPNAERKVTAATTAKPSKTHWGYWMIGLGLAFIVGFLLARLTR